MGLYPSPYVRITRQVFPVQPESEPELVKQRAKSFLRRRVRRSNKAHNGATFFR